VLLPWLAGVSTGRLTERLAECRSDGAWRTPCRLVRLGTIGDGDHLGMVYDGVNPTATIGWPSNCLVMSGWWTRDPDGRSEASGFAAKSSQNLRSIEHFVHEELVGGSEPLSCLMIRYNSLLSWQLRIFETLI